MQSIDFFTPIVDDPYTYGMIAAANSLSDIYAMGGAPITALNVVIYPTSSLPSAVLGEILRGGADTMGRIKVPIIGGHTVEGEEPLYGLAVTGVVHPDRAVLPSQGKSGDLLILTKPIGTGVIATALKAEAVQPQDLESAVTWMTRLNRTASEAMVNVGARAATDVTGFGLLGHLSQMARASGLAAELTGSSIPLLVGAIGYAQRGYVPAGGRTNQEYVETLVDWSESIQESLQVLLTDPQTSGGLVIAVGEREHTALRDALKQAGDLDVVIGRFVEGEPGHISVQ